MEVDFFSDEKIMIFCVIDLYVDMVKWFLDDVFKELYNGEYN